MVKLMDDLDVFSHWSMGLRTVALGMASKDTFPAKDYERELV